MVTERKFKCLDSISHIVHEGKSKASGLAIVNNVRNGIKLLNFRSVTIFAGDLAQCGHMMALKAVHELEKKNFNFLSIFHKCCFYIYC